MWNMAVLMTMAAELDTTTKYAKDPGHGEITEVLMR
jgi:hypothetical protein